MTAPVEAEHLEGDLRHRTRSTLAVEGVELIAPHRNNRRKPRTQDGRKLRRYKRCWKIERLFAHMGNFRCLVVRYERSAENFLGFVHLGCTKLLLRRF